jgi:hypothetical protein
MEECGREKNPAYCYFEFDESNGKKYGKLYNWYALNDSRGLAPIGYRIPSEDEWKKLSDFLGGSNEAGKKLKTMTGWKKKLKDNTQKCPDCASWNESYRKKVPCHTCQDSRLVLIPEVKEVDESSKIGFMALPGGFCKYDGSFYFNEERSYWWLPKEETSEKSLSIFLEYSSHELQNDTHYKESGCSVRCIKD